MSKKYSTALFELIQNLSKAEKRYFKIFSSRHTIGEENNYIRLFDYIDQLEEYDEAILFEHFKGEPFLNKFSITKSRLYDHLLRALDSFHSNNSIDAQLHRMLHGADILYNKGLYDQSKKELISARKIAEKNQKQFILQEINHRFKRLIETFNYTSSSQEDLSTLFESDQSLSLHIEYQNNLWFYKSQLFKLLNCKGQIRSDEERKEFDQIFHAIQDLKRPDSQTFESRYLENHILSAYHFATLNQNKSLEYLLANFQLLEDNIEKIKQEPSRMMVVLSNIIHLCTAIMDFQSADKYLDELKQFADKYQIELSTDLKIKYFSSTSSIELMLVNQTGNFERVAQIAQQIEKGLNEFSTTISGTRKAYLSFQLGTAFFGIGDFHKSLKWINTITNETQLDEKEDIAAFANILSVIIHFELNNERFLPYSIRNAVRFLKKRNRSYKIESLFLKYFTKLLRTTNHFDRLELIEEIEQSIHQIALDPLESVALEYFDFTTWLESKRMQCSFSELKKAKFLKKSAA